MGVPLNLLVVIGANFPPEALGETRTIDDDLKGKCFYHGPAPGGDGGATQQLCEDLATGSRPERDRARARFRDFEVGSHSNSSLYKRREMTPVSLEARAGGAGRGLRYPPLQMTAPLAGFGLATGTASPSAAPGLDRHAPWEEEEEQCQCSCPGMRTVRRSLSQVVDSIGHDASKGRIATGSEDEEAKKVTLVMSRDNVAALAIIASLSILGAIYLWKICTHRHCACRICRNQYRQLHLIGSGGYGAVYLVDRPTDDTSFVAKKIPVRDITEVDEYSKEAKDLVTLRHRHIVSYEEDFVHVEYGAFEPKIYFIIVMEYCPEGDLKEKIEQDFCSFTEDWVRTVFAQLLQAVQYLHSKNVIHRDLKSQNVFLALDGHVRLGDFGLCRHARTPGLGSASFSHAGTDCYMAPEMLSSSRYGKPADMWSLGCVLYELCAGQFMWELDGILGAMVMSDPQTVQKLVQENVVSVLSPATRAVLRRLLSTKPEARPTATGCIRRKLFKRGFSVSREPFGNYFEREAVETSVDAQLGSPRGSCDGIVGVNMSMRSTCDDDAELADFNGEGSDSSNDDCCTDASAAAEDEGSDRVTESSCGSCGRLQAPVMVRRKFKRRRSIKR